MHPTMGQVLTYNLIEDLREHLRASQRNHPPKRRGFSGERALGSSDALALASFQPFAPSLKSQLGSRRCTAAPIALQARRSAFGWRKVYHRKAPAHTYAEMRWPKVFGWPWRGCQKRIANYCSRGI